jgi:hypothetical protein
VLRRQWPDGLRDLFDVVMDDGSRMKLRKAAAERLESALRADHLQTTRPTAVKALLGAALLACALAERIHRALAQQEGLTKVSVDRCSLVLASAFPRIVQLLAYEHTQRALSFEAIARVVTHESRHPNPRQPHLRSEVFSLMPRAA